jgi:AraC-like DNA-binding protein
MSASTHEAMANGSGNRIQFDSDALPERERFPMFCEEMRRYAALDICRRGGDGNFRASIDLQRANAIGIGHITTTPSDYGRSAPLIRDGDDALCVVLCLNGAAYQTQRDDDRGLQAGEGVICDNGYVGSIHVLAESQFWSLKIPRPMIARQLPDVSRFAGMKLDRSPAARRLLFGYLRSMRELDLTADRTAAARCEEHVVDLIALTLGAQGEARRLAEERGVRAARRTAVLRAIEGRSDDPGLSAAAVAATLGVTARYVHLLLEETGKSFTHHVLERRLKRAGALLCDPRWRHRRIADIAAEAGFTDLSYFNRAFRRHFGATPSDMREGAPR